MPQQFFCKFIQSCFCCDYCPKSAWLLTSSCTKSLYFFIFTIGFMLLCIALALPSVTKSFPFCYEKETFVCENYSNFIAIYRIAFTFALFFCIMCICTFGISSSRNDRSAAHNGFWFFKLAFLGLMLYGTSYIPYGLFDLVLMYLGLIFVSTFNVFELLLYCNLMTDLGSFCLIFFWREGPACVKFILTFMMFALFLSGMMVGLFLLFAYKSCTINLVFIILNLSLSYLINIVSIFVKYFQRQMFAALKGSVLCIHIMCITWSAIANNPQKECNPPNDANFWSFTINNYFTIFCVWIGVLLALEYFFREGKKDETNAIIVVEERGKEFCGVWGKKRVVETIQPQNPDGATIIYTTTDETDDEYTSLRYSWFATHDIFLQGIFYMMFCLTDNYVLNWDRNYKIPNYYNDTAMWFKMVSTWICILIFLIIDFFTDRRTGRVFY